MIHHYLTKYVDEHDRFIAESWIQFNLFKWSFCFSKRQMILKKPSEDD